MSNGNRLLRCRLSFLATLVLAMASAQHVSGQQPQRPDFVASLSAGDVATLVTRCGGAEPLAESLELFQNHAGTRVMILAGSPADGNSGGPPRIKEETIRNDFSTLFDFDWLRDIHFDSPNSDAQGPSAWSIHLRRKDE